jgi:hypothetical protein
MVHAHAHFHNVKLHFENGRYMHVSGGVRNRREPR